MKRTNIFWLGAFLVASLVLAATTPTLLGRGGGGGGHGGGGGGARPARLPFDGPQRVAFRTKCVPAAGCLATCAAITTVAFASEPAKARPAPTPAPRPAMGISKPSTPATKPVAPGSFSKAVRTG